MWIFKIFERTGREKNVSFRTPRTAIFSQCFTMVVSSQNSTGDHSNSQTLNDSEVVANPDRIWQKGKHIPHLDGVRGIAILMVTLYRFAIEIPTDSVIGGALKSTLSLGTRGVELFFVLSGFLITGILLDAKKRERYFTNFFARRSLRIFPLYLVSLSLILIVFNNSYPWQGDFSPGSENQFYLWTWLTNIQLSIEGSWCFGYLDHFWSLAVEEHFYLFWPFAIFFIPTKYILRVAAGLMIGSALTRILFAGISENGVAPDVLTLFRCDALLMGAIVAIKIRSPEGIKPWIKWVFPLASLCLLFAVGVDLAGKRLLTLSLTAWPIFWSGALIWILLCKRESITAKIVSLKFLRSLGKYSYAMYVFQNPLIPIVAGLATAFSYPLPSETSLGFGLSYLIGMTVLTYLIAISSWHILEKHCLKLKSFFGGHAKSKDFVSKKFSVGELHHNQSPISAS